MCRQREANEEGPAGTSAELCVCLPRCALTLWLFSHSADVDATPINICHSLQNEIGSLTGSSYFGRHRADLLQTDNHTGGKKISQESVLVGRCF